MNLLLAFAPFITFVVVDRLFGPTAGLAAAAVVSAYVLIDQRFRKRTGWKILDVAAFFLFCCLTVLSFTIGNNWTLATVRLLVDSGLLAIVLLTLAVGQPFTLQFAREKALPAVWNNPEFIRSNYILSTVWAATFAVIVLIDFAMLRNPELPPKIALGGIVLAIIGASRFIDWYAGRQRHHALANGSLQ